MSALRTTILTMTKLWKYSLHVIMLGICGQHYGCSVECPFPPMDTGYSVKIS